MKYSSSISKIVICSLMLSVVGNSAILAQAQTTVNVGDTQTFDRSTDENGNTTYRVSDSANMSAMSGWVGDDYYEKKIQAAEEKQTKQNIVRAAGIAGAVAGVGMIVAAGIGLKDNPGAQAGVVFGGITVAGAGAAAALSAHGGLQTTTRRIRTLESAQQDNADNMLNSAYVQDMFNRKQVSSVDPATGVQTVIGLNGQEYVTIDGDIVKANREQEKANLEQEKANLEKEIELAKINVGRDVAVAQHQASARMAVAGKQAELQARLADESAKQQEAKLAAETAEQEENRRREEKANLEKLTMDAYDKCSASCKKNAIISLFTRYNVEKERACVDSCVIKLVAIAKSEISSSMNYSIGITDEHVKKVEESLRIVNSQLETDSFYCFINADVSSYRIQNSNTSPNGWNVQGVELNAQNSADAEKQCSDLFLRNQSSSSVASGGNWCCNVTGSGFARLKPYILQDLSSGVCKVSWKSKTLRNMNMQKARTECQHHIEDLNR